MRTFKLILALSLLLCVSAGAEFYKDTSGIITFALYDTTDNSLVTGDAAQLVASVSIDGDTTPDPLTDTTATEIGTTGRYQFDVTAAETNGTHILYFCSSRTSTDYQAVLDGVYTSTVEATAQGIPNTAEFEARTLPASEYFDPTADPVANVTLVDTVTTTADMRGTDSAYTGTPPTAAEIRAEIDSNSTQLAALLEDTGTTLPATLATLATAAGLAAHDGQMDTVDGIVDALLVIANKLDDTLELDDAEYRFTANALENAPSGGAAGDATAASQALILADLAEMKGSGFSASTDSLEAIRNRGDAAWIGGAGDGAVTFTYTLTDSVSSAPIDDVLVEVFTESAMTNKVAARRTDAFGKCTFYLDAGTYYLKRSKGGYTFTNPDTEVVAP